VNTYEPRGEHPLKSGNVEDEGKGGKMQNKFYLGYAKEVV